MLINIAQVADLAELSWLDQKVALVTGSSSGIGFETSLLLARNGFYTYATMRNLDKSMHIMDLARKGSLPIQVLELDVDEDKSVSDAVKKIVSERNRIDVLVNNAGYGLVGCVEDLSIDELEAIFETNLFGIIRVTQAVLPAMRKQRSGTIVNISSVAGRIGFPVTPAYISTKFALEGLSECMRYELEQFGIRVVIIEPGAVRTRFSDNMKVARKANDPNSPYAQLTQKVFAGLKLLLEHGTPPDEVARVILKAATSINPELRYLAGNDAVMVLEARKNMSDTDFEKFMKREILQ
ncbi:MAG: SDR family oxidoreductase [Nitrososphaerales archaeon]